MTVNEKGLEAAQVAAREGCGLFIESQHVFCDDPVVGEAADGYGKPLRQPYCSCKGDAERIIKAYLRASSNDVGTTGSLPRLANCGRYLAEDNTGQWHYINHAGEWQTCPPPSAGTGTSGWDWSVDAVDVLPFSLSDLERNATAQSVRYAIEILESNGYDILAPSAVRVPQWKQPAADDIDAAWLSLLEEDDRASPEEYPDHVLITKNKLHSIVSSFVAPASPEPSPSTEDVMGEARGALAIALSAIEKAGDDLQASGAYPVGALAALIVPAEQVRTAITNIDRALSSKQRSGE